MPSRTDRRARAGTTAIFFMTGWTYAAWATRVPAVKDELGLSPGSLAVAIGGLEAGAFVGLPAGAVLAARLGSRRALRVGFWIMPAALVLAAMAAATSVVDVGMNAQGVELERRYERPILSGLHAAHPAGLAAGGLLGTAVAAVDVPVEAHFTAVAAVSLPGATSATFLLVDEPAHDGPRTL